MKRLVLACFACILVSVFAVSARAEGFALTDYSARGTALAGGMVGRADDASAVAYNPAGITQLPGARFMMGGTVVMPTGQVVVKDRAGMEHDQKVEDRMWANPHIYGTYQISDTVWFGVGLFSRFGLGNAYPSDWQGRTGLVDVQLQTVSINPNVAVKINEHLSLALGIEVMGASMLMRKDMYLGQLGYDQQKMKGKSAAFGVNLAAHYIFNDEWKAGLTYRSRVQQKVEGKSYWEKQYPSLPGGVKVLNSDLHGTLNLPDVFTLGVAYAPNQAWSFEVGTAYTVWSNYRSLNIYLEDPMNTVGWSPKDWKDTWTFNVSAEYKPLDWLTLRAGYMYETSPMNTSTVDYMTPSDGRHRLSVGTGFVWDQWTLDIAYSYLIINSLDYTSSTAVSATASRDGTSGVKGHGGHANIIAATLGYTF